jgi:tungstate transport system substrate-binding protein
MYSQRRPNVAPGEAGIDISAQKGPWYKDIGQGMGAALNTASATNSYLLSDRGTWLSFKNKGDLVIIVEGDNHLFNQYEGALRNRRRNKHDHIDGREWDAAGTREDDRQEEAYVLAAPAPG